MQISEKVILKWDFLQNNWSSSFGNLRKDEDFSDVTLASEDGIHIKCHKVILASSSPFFTEMLKKVKHPHPLIYMKGVKALELAAMVDFLYLGEASLNKESLDAFLCLAEELRLRGLSGATVDGKGSNTESEAESKLNSRQSLETELVENFKATSFPKEHGGDGVEVPDQSGEQLPDQIAGASAQQLPLKLEAQVTVSFFL